MTDKEKEEFRRKLEAMTPEAQALYMNGMVNKLRKAIEQKKESDSDLKLRMMGVLDPDVESLLAEAGQVLGDYLQEAIKDDLTKATN